MSFLRNIGGLFIKHYEKVIVALALVAFLGAVVYLYGVRQAEEVKIREYDRTVLKKQGKAVAAVDLALFSNALEKAKNPPALDFGLPHYIFNSVKWQKRPDGSWMKIEQGTEVGGAAMKLVKTTPLSTVITIDRPTPGGLYMGAVQEASTNAGMRRKISQYLSTNNQHTTKLFTLRDIRGTPEKPEAVVELTTGEKVPITIDKPYTQVEGFSADLQYPPENQSFNNKRAGDVISVGGEDYIIVAITENEVVVSARSNNRRTTIRK
ncbi:MAG TPA: hypothetical protein VK530_06840 [Candidatus Acidoferrum sp.]|nr:hypothetical protein [Candidatus Acidoferrum sp.]